MFNFCWFRKAPPVVEPVKKLDITKLTLAPNPRYASGKLWGFRPESMIEKIIVHQAMSEADTIAIHNYHISETSHIKRGGAPKICYHYTIEKDGKVYLVNDHTDIVWHCKGQNLISLGVLLLGDFEGPDHVGRSKPTEEQLASLSQLLDLLTSELNIAVKDIYGHLDFGKPACPGFEVMKHLHKYKG